MTLHFPKLFLLIGNSIVCVEYHDSPIKPLSQDEFESFMCNEINVLITTVSYGLSIHKPDVRNIIHLSCIKDIETYYHEIGRGGRDGLPTRCIIFYPPTLYKVPP